MDDIRRPEPNRRDYALPPNRPTPPHQPHPQHHPEPHHQPHHQPAHPHHQTPQHHTPQPDYQQPEYAQPAHHQPHHQALPSEQSRQAQPAPIVQKTGRRLKFGKKLSIAVGVVLAAVAIFGAGWLLKGSGSSENGIPQSITRQVNYNLYFPSPMPQGYTYMKDSATFQIGQVYYKFAKGKKRVTVTEQPMPSQKPDLSLLHGYIQFDSPVGQAAVGTNLGESQAVILTPTTVITMNTVGGVSTDELRTAVSNLKNIGQNPANKANNG